MSFSFDAGSYRYPSRRRVVFAGNGMVCASQPLAAQAGVDALPPRRQTQWTPCSPPRGA